jgi:hypothetical protein
MSGHQSGAFPDAFATSRHARATRRRCSRRPVRGAARQLVVAGPLAQLLRRRAHARSRLLDFSRALISSSFACSASGSDPLPVTAESCSAAAFAGNAGSNPAADTTDSLPETGTWQHPRRTLVRQLEQFFYVTDPGTLGRWSRGNRSAPEFVRALRAPTRYAPGLSKTRQRPKAPTASAIELDAPPPKARGPSPAAGVFVLPGVRSRGYDRVPEGVHQRPSTAAATRADPRCLQRVRGRERTQLPAVSALVLPS